MNQQEIILPKPIETSQQKQNHYLREFYSTLDELTGSTNHGDFIPRGFISSNGNSDSYSKLLQINGIGPTIILKRGDNRCLCGHYIQELHFIENIKNPGPWIQVGNCCVKRFKEGKKHRCCEGCFKKFASKKNIYCPDCRKSKK